MTGYIIAGAIGGAVGVVGALLVIIALILTQDC
jgi:hypothetical protein